MKDIQQRIKDYEKGIEILKNTEFPKGFCYFLKPIQNYPEITSQKPFYIKEVTNWGFVAYHNPISKYHLFWFSPYWRKLRILMLRIAIIKAKRKLKKGNGDN